jgi:hypothetical protein
LGGVNRPVGDQGKTRPGSTGFSSLIHGSLDRVFTLASQAANPDPGNFSGLEIVHGAGGTCAVAFQDVPINLGGGDLGMTRETPGRWDIGAGFEQVRRERTGFGPKENPPVCGNHPEIKCAQDSIWNAESWIVGSNVTPHDLHHEYIGSQPCPQDKVVSRRRLVEGVRSPGCGPAASKPV